MPYLYIFTLSRGPTNLGSTRFGAHVKGVFVIFCWDKVRFYPGDLRIRVCDVDTSHNVYKLL